MAGIKTDKPTHGPWEYPHTLKDDPAGEDERREWYEGTSDCQVAQDAATTAYWQRRADHAAKWLSANPDAPSQVLGAAIKYRVISERNAKTAGGRKPSYEHSDLKFEYAETGNRLYAWQAIAHVLNNAESAAGADLFGPVELPYWCAQVIMAFANELVTLGLPGHPAASAENVQRALRLSSQGRSAYGERERRQRDQENSDVAALLEMAGMTPARAREVAITRSGNARHRRKIAKKAAPRVRPLDET